MTPSTTMEWFRALKQRMPPSMPLEVDRKFWPYRVLNYHFATLDGARAFARAYSEDGVHLVPSILHRETNALIYED